MAKLEVKNLTISFRTNNGAVRAVRDISFNLNEGETLAIAGESGSGKSVTTRAVMGILAGNAMVDNGEIIYDGRDLLKISEDDFHTLRGHKLAMVFQDPLSALNPIMKIGKQLTEAMLLNNKERRRDGRTQFNKMLEQLEKAIVEEKTARGESGDVKAQVQQKIKEFDSFTVAGIKMEDAYKRAQESIVGCQDSIEEIEIAILRKNEKSVREIVGRLKDACAACCDPFLIPKEDSDYAALVEKLEPMKKGFNIDQADELRNLLGELKAKYAAASAKEQPSFFCIGYYSQKGGTIDPSRSSIREINAAAERSLNEGFLNDFMKDVAKAIEYSEKQNASMQKQAIAVLKAELPVFKAEKLEERACRAAAGRAAAAVEKAIDPLKLNKDNQSYVFKSSIKANLDRYFKGVEQNPKEQKRFDRDAAKHQKLVARGKHADSVVPLNLIDLDIAYRNIVNAIEQLIANYEGAIAGVGSQDYVKGAADMIEYLKARASEYAYTLSKTMARHRAIELMKEVGIPEPHKRFNQYPFELSGGMRQRIVIAIALSANPDILICDEPTTALDVTIQAQILELINRLKEERKLPVIFITHDLGVVANMADRIAIMYAGKIVEYGTADDVFYDPRNPYTWALLSSMPDLETKEKLEAIPGTSPNMIIPPKGDAFAARNHYAMQIDFEEQPPMFQVSETHQAATWLLHPNAPKVEPPAIVLERIKRMQNKQAAAEVEAYGMRNIKKLVAALRAVAVVLLLLAVTSTIYNLATTGTAWKELKEKLDSVGADTGLVERGKFDAAYNAALSASSAAGKETISTRSQIVAGKLNHFVESGTLAEALQSEQNLLAEYEYFDTEFDAAGYVESLASRSNPEEIKRLAEIYEQLDGLAAPAKGKKIAKLKLADNRPAFEELHAAWTEEHGAEVGSFYEFSQTVSIMIQEAIDGGESITDAAAYFTANVGYEDYLVKLAEVLSAEAGEASESFLDSFAALAGQKAAGESVDFEAFFRAQYEIVSGLYPNQAMSSYPLFVTTAHSLIDAGAAFDGTYGSIYAAVQKAQETENANSFSRFMSSFSRSVVETSDGAVGFFQYLWFVVSLYWLMYVLAAALAILAVVLDRVLSYALVARQERKHIQDDPDVLLRVNHLKQYFRSGDFVNKAVDDVSFYVKKGEVFGLVGESGCGKTTTGRTIINLYDPTEGDVYFQGLRISSNQNGLPVLIRQLHNEHEQAVSQLRKELEAKVKANPERKSELTGECNAKIKELEKQLADRIEGAQMSALESSVEKNRCVKAYREKRQAELTAEYEADMQNLSGKAAQERKERYKLEMKVAASDNIMTKMQMIFQDPIASINPRMTVREIIAEGLIIRGVKDKAYIDEKVYEMLELVGLVREHADRYPHEFSGGQRQRIGIARAIVMEPDLIIADEPISALDVSIQAQVINLLNELRNKMGLTIMFIAHNLSVVKYFSDRIAVMYFGKIVEMTTSDELFEHPLHPYTKSLLSAIPYPDPHYEKQRRRIEYKPELVHDYSVDKPVMREITPGHFIYCNNAEFEAYKKELGI